MAATQKNEPEGKDLGTCGLEIGYKIDRKHSSLVRILILDLRFTSEM